MNRNDTGLLRPRYFDRQQLRAADLTVAQEYLRDRLRRHNRFLHGWGVVCGAEVTKVAGNPWEVHIAEGYILTPHGDEVYIPDGISPFNIEEQMQACLGSLLPCADPTDLEDVQATQCINFKSFIPGSIGTNPRVEQEIAFRVFGFDGSPAAQTQIDSFGDFTGFNCNAQTSITLPTPTSQVELELVHFAAPVSIEAFNADGSSAGVATMSGPQNQAETLTVAGVAITQVVITAPQNEALLLSFCWVSSNGDCVYLVACPADELRCPQPSVPANCQPGGGVYEYSRIRETVQFKIVCDLPPSHQQEEPSCVELEEMVCGQAHIPCPPATNANDNCVVLARIAVGGDSAIQIDDLSERRQLFSESLLQAYLRCRCETVEVECVDFEDLSLDAIFRVGDSFVDSGVTVTGQTFFWSNGGSTDNGFARIEDGERAGGSGQEAQVNNINLAFDFGKTLSDLGLRFGEFGGNLNLEVNGDMRNFEDFAEIDGGNIGGVKVSIMAAASEAQGVLALQGQINSFAIGGQELWIDDVCPHAITVEAEPPNAAFFAEPNTGQAPLTVNFTDQSSGQITAWTWSFGDGGTSDQQNPSYTYFEAGTYTVMLTVIGPGGAATTSETITVEAGPPSASFLSEPGTGVVPLTVSFTDLSSGVITSRAWNFGDGDSSNEQNPVHTYQAAGTYTVTLTVTGPSGTDTVDETIVVGPAPPDADFDYVHDPQPGGNFLTYNFTDRSSGVINTWDWNFGDGENSNQQNPIHAYDSPGPYTVSLTVTGPGGTDTVSKNIIFGLAFETLTVDLDETEFDLERGRYEPIDAISGIGGIRGGRLREAGADNVLVLATLPPERTAEIAEVSMEVATRWRDVALELMRR